MRAGWVVPAVILLILAAAPAQPARRRREEVTSLERVYRLARAGRDAEAAALLRSRPSLYRQPGRRAQRPSRTGDAATLIRRAGAETAAMTNRCAVCHYREPAIYGPAVTRVLFRDRELLLQALEIHRKASARRPFRSDTRRTGEIYFDLANLYPPKHREAGDYMRRARRWMERAVKLDSQDTRAWNQLGSARLKLRDGAGAEAAWRKSLAVGPDQEEPWVNLAGLLQSRGSTAEAVELYSQALKRLPRSAALRTNYGVFLWQSGRNQEAAAAHREALRLKPEDPVALLNLGLALKAAGELRGAEEAIRTSIRRRPSGAIAHNALGSLLAARGDWAAAARAFEEATRRNPGLAAAHANLGLALEHLGRLEEATRAYRRAILWQPERRDLRDRLARLRRPAES